MNETESAADLAGGVRLIAMFEALKGTLVLTAGFGVLSLGGGWGQSCTLVLWQPG